MQSFTSWWIDNYMGWGEFLTPPTGPMPGSEDMHNPVAKDVRTPKYRQRVVKPRKGKGSYSRKEKHNA